VGAGRDGSAARRDETVGRLYIGHPVNGVHAHSFILESKAQM
jgi:hypothetical protein